MKIYITGCSGFVGGALAKSLSGHHEVICLKRDEYASTEFDSGSIVIHAAAKVHQRGSKTPKELAEYTKANCELTLNIAKSAIKNKAKLMIFMSTALVMGGLEGSFSEDATPAPDMPYGMSKLAAEWGLKNLFAATKTSACAALRLPMIYGENAKGNYALLIKLARLGVPLPLASVTKKRSFLFIGNLVSAVETMIEKNDKVRNFEVFNISDGEDITSGELYNRLFRSLKGRDGVFEMDEEVIKKAADFPGFGFLKKLVSEYRFSSSKFQRVYDWQPPYQAGGFLR